MALVEDAEAGMTAVRVGATHLQLRLPAAPTARLEREAAVLVGQAGVPLLISSRVDVALAIGAAGVNLPEADLPVVAARRLLGPAALIGRSAHSLEVASRAEAEGADFVVYGPVFETPSHPRRPPLGLRRLAQVTAALGIPVLAIGGVTAANVEQVRAAGAAGYAAISAFRR